MKRSDAELDARLADEQTWTPVPVEAVVRQCIKRLTTVAFRIRAPLRNRDWTTRLHDAYIIETEVLPALERLANARPHAEERSDDSQQRVVGQSGS